MLATVQASLLWHLLYMHLWYIHNFFIHFLCTHILGVTCGVLETVQAFILRHLLYMHVTYICIFLNYSMRSVRSVSNSAGLPTAASAVQACFIYLHFFSIIIGGPCGVFATVQAFLLRQLYMHVTYIYIFLELF